MTFFDIVVLIFRYLPASTIFSDVICLPLGLPYLALSLRFVQIIGFAHNEHKCSVSFELIQFKWKKMLRIRKICHSKMCVFIFGLRTGEPKVYNWRKKNGIYNGKKSVTYVEHLKPFDVTIKNRHYNQVVALSCNGFELFGLCVAMCDTSFWRVQYQFFFSFMYRVELVWKCRG